MLTIIYNNNASLLNQKNQNISYNLIAVKCYLYTGGVQSHVSFPDGIKLGLTTGLAHEVHQAVFIGQTKEGGVAELTQFPDQQLVRQVAVLLAANAKDLRGQLLKLPEIRQASIPNTI